METTAKFRRLQIQKHPPLPFHLLFPLFSSILFVFGMMLAKKAIDGGARPWTGTFLANLWLALVWGLIAIVRGSVIPPEA